MKSYIPSIAKKRVKKLREKGLSIGGVAYELGCSRSTVRNYLLKTNYKFRKYKRTLKANL